MISNAHVDHPGQPKDCTLMYGHHGPWRDLGIGTAGRFLLEIFSRFQGAPIGHVQSLWGVSSPNLSW